MTYRLGLDIGTGSIGFALVKFTGEREGEILLAGSHLFDSSEQQGKSNNIARRIARLSRRRIRRRGNRLKNIYALFQKYLPHAFSNSFEVWKENATRQQNISKIDVWELRKDALYRRLTEEELGRVLYNIAKFRGWKAMTRSEENDIDEDIGRMKEGMNILERAIRDGGYRTVGECLYSLHCKEGKAIHNKGAYTFVSRREIIQNEVKEIFTKQREFNNIYATEEFEEEYSEIAFHQLPQKSVWDMVGECTYELGQKRAPKHSPSAELFDAINMLNNVCLRNKETGEVLNLTRVQKEMLLENAFEKIDNKIAIKDICKILDEDSNHWTTNYDKEDIQFGTNAIDFCGTYTIYAILEKYGLIRKIDNPMQYTLDELQHMCFIADMVSFWTQSPEEIMSIENPGATNDKRGIYEFQKRFIKIKHYFKTDEDTIYTILKEIEEGINGRRKISFKESHSLSVKALHTLLPDMKRWEPFHKVKNILVEKGKRQYSDISSFNLKKIPVFLPFEDSSNEDKSYHRMKQKTVEWLKERWNIYSDEKYSQEKAQDIAGVMLRQEKEIRNNRVLHRAISQARKLINRIIDTYGKPELIRIELAREVGKGEKKRSKIVSEQGDKKRVNDRIRKEIIDHFVDIKGKSVGDAELEVGKYLLKKKLWEEQGGECPYCFTIDGETVTTSKRSVSDIYDGDYEIDHILPWSKTFDDSFSNKVLCCSKCNQDKGQRSPWQWLYKEGSQDLWDSFKNNIERIYGNSSDSKGGKDKQSSKKDRFLFEGIDFSGFATRSIKDTQYITSLFSNILQQYLGRQGEVYVQPINGSITSVLRTMWRLPYKEREDKRHHGMDAIVIAASSLKDDRELSKYIQMKEDAKNEERELHISQEQEKEKCLTYIDKMYNKYGTYIAKPWKSFTQDFEKAYENIFVTRKIEAKVTGALHKDTIFSLSKENGKCYSRTSVQELFDKDTFVLRNRDKRTPIEKQNLYKALKEWQQERKTLEEQYKSEEKRLNDIPEYKEIEKTIKDKEKELNTVEKKQTGLIRRITKDKETLEKKEQKQLTYLLGSKNYKKEANVIDKLKVKINENEEKHEKQNKDIQILQSEIDNLQNRKEIYESHLMEIKKQKNSKLYPCLPNTVTPIKKVWIEEKKTGVTYEKWNGDKAQGLAQNANQVRVDLFQHKKNSTWTLVIIYADDMLRRNTSGREYLFRNPKECYLQQETIQYCIKYKGSKNLGEYEYRLSLQKNEYVVVIDKEDNIYHGYYNTAPSNARIDFIYHFLHHQNRIVPGLNKAEEIKNKIPLQHNNYRLKQLLQEIESKKIKGRVSITSMKYIFKMPIDLLETKESFIHKLNQKIENRYLLITK